MKKVNLFFVIMLMTVTILMSGCGSMDKTSEQETFDNSGTEEPVMEYGDAEGSSEEAVSSKEETLFGLFYTQSLDGEDVTEEIFSEAKLTMVNIWGTFCGPCIQEMPDLGELDRAYAEEGFQIVGLISDVDQPKDETAMEIVESTNVDYVNMIASQDLNNNVLQYVSVVPTTVFVDSEGMMVGGVYSGSRDMAAWAEIVDELLTEVK